MNFSDFTLSGWIKLSIVFAWCLLFALLLRRDVFIEAVESSDLTAVKLAESEEYQSIYFKDEKIGFVVSRFSKTETEDWLLQQEATMKLNVAETVQNIELELEATLSNSNHLKDFKFSFTSPFYRMSASGVVENNRVVYTLDTGTNTIESSMSFSNWPMLATSRRGYLLKQGLEKGEKRRVPWFDPVSLTGKESVIEYKGKESILVQGRVFNLHHFIESSSGVKVNSWLNDEGVIVKEESPAGFVFIKEPKFKALTMGKVTEEILSAVSVKVVGKMPAIAGDSMYYRLQFPEELQLDLVGGRQTMQDNMLVVQQEQLPISGQGSCTLSGKSLKPSAYIQADHPEIVKLSKDLTKSSSNQVQAITTIANWVYENLEKKPVLGLPDSLTTLRNLQGDCNEHAALFAALARAAEVPTRVVAGVTYHKEGFYYHAWNEVCLDNRWISIDTTTNQFPADLTHIRFVVGEMQEQVRIGGLLGNLTIEPITPLNTQ